MNACVCVSVVCARMSMTRFTRCARVVRGGGGARSYEEAMQWLEAQRFAGRGKRAVEAARNSAPLVRFPLGTPSWP